MVNSEFIAHFNTCVAYQTYIMMLWVMAWPWLVILNRFTHTDQCGNANIMYMTKFDST